MPIISRDKTTIRGLKAHLEDLASQLSALEDKGGLSPEEKELLDLLTVTQPIDLDGAVTTTRLATNISDLASDTLAANVNAIRDYVIGALQLGGPGVMVESLPVNDNHITLNHKPHPGLSGILNYSSVRYLQDGQVHELDLAATEDPYRFTIDPQTFDLVGKQVKIQYLYHHAPRDLNDLIGELIMNGLVLNEPA
jgi:hypothetical protein